MTLRLRLVRHTPIQSVVVEGYSSNTFANSVRTHGLPVPDDRKLDACAMPYIFQELNYDGYDWSNRTEDFDHLSDIVDIDVIMWSGGRDRTELTDDEFAAYNAFCHNAIKYRSR